MRLLLTAYGNEKQEDKGIIEIVYDEKDNRLDKKRIISLQGKCNLVGETDCEIILCEEFEGKNLLKFYDSKSYELKKAFETRYIYNYMQIFDDYILFASFKSGVDALFDRKENRIIKEVVHERDGKQSGRSHYIRQLKDGRVVSVENGLNQIYLYRNKDLEIENVIDFEEKNIRLMNFADEEKTVFLNTEVSNELLVLDGKDFHLKQSLKLTEDEKSFSGGHTVSDDGHYDFVGIRGEDTLAVFENRNGEVSLLEKIPCGKTPRDLYWLEGCLFASCTGENAVEVYKIEEAGLKKMTCVEVYQPITFEIRS